jgi:hypothetical protein
MSNYNEKYLKYKKKYINLKNELELEGGFFGKPKPQVPKYKDRIIFYDKKNKVADHFFSDIKKQYKKYLTYNDEFNKYFMLGKKYKRGINALLNVYTYKIGDKNANSELIFDFNNICLKDDPCVKPKHRSGRLQKLVIPFNKAIGDYYEKSKITLEDKLIIKDDNILFAPQNFRAQCDRILNHINRSINNDSRVQATKNLLQLIELYQSKSTTSDIPYITQRLGKLTDASIIVPSGLSTEKTKEKLSGLSAC